MRKAETEASGHPQGAETLWTPNQRAIYVGIILGAAACASIDFSVFFKLFSVSILLAYMCVVGTRVFAVLAGLVKRNTVGLSEHGERTADKDLPVYSILLPVYREAGVIPLLLKSVRELDYPQDKLDVKLLLEADDAEGISAIKTLSLPQNVETIVVRDVGPKTKPRACNEGLERARGEYVVIFDAEDRPEHDQLRKAVSAFAGLPGKVVCLQAKLNYYNSKENLLTRWCALEYSAWFDLYLPGLHAIGAPIPLGGTSNHFRTSALREIGGWDPYNVTEDCDLGMRLAWNGRETRVVDSTTWEESVIHWGPWLRQRSRWMKGYWQTHLCHTRNPLSGIIKLGLWKWLMMLITVGGHVFTLLMNPISWIIAGLWLWYRWDLCDPDTRMAEAFIAVTAAMALFNVLFVAIHVVAAFRRRRFDLMPLALLMPIYWILVSVGAWRGFLQFFTKPFAWEKTPHGLTQVASEQHHHSVFSAYHKSRRAGLLTAAVVALIAVTLLAIASRASKWSGMSSKVNVVHMDGKCMAKEIVVEQSWVGNDALEVQIKPFMGKASETAHVSGGQFKGLVYVTVDDGQWYQLAIEPHDITTTADSIVLRASLTSSWQRVDSGPKWGPWCLRRVRTFGVRLFGAIQGMDTIEVSLLKPSSSEAQHPPILAEVLGAELSVKKGSVFEGRFLLNKEYRNPFDPDEIDIQGVFRDSDGQECSIPAFYTRAYTRSLENGVEKLQAFGRPYWAVRYVPLKPGTHTWHLKGKDKTGAELLTEPATFNAVDSPGRGYVRVDKDPRFFSFSNGEFYYPLPLNLRSPSDEKSALIDWANVPDQRGGTYVMDRYIDIMSESGINLGRMWMMPSWCGLEWDKAWPGYHGLGFINLQNAWRIEHLLNYAESKNVLLELALDAHGPFTMEYDSQWRINPYNARLGGPIKRYYEVMTNEEAKRLFKIRYRYSAARFGASPALFGWTLWIEANVVNQSTRHLAIWHEEMAGYMKSVDASRHVVSTEFNSSEGDAAVWSLPQIDYTQVAAYNFGMGLPHHISYASRALERFNKPSMIEEYGGHAQGGQSRWIAHEIHDGLYLGWVSSLSASPMPWWWNMILEGKLTRYHKRFGEYIAGEDLRGRQWKYASSAVGGTNNLEALAKYDANSAYMWIFGEVSQFRYSNVNYWSQAGYGAQAYRRKINDFDIFAQDPGPLFPAAEDTWIDLLPLGLADGKYDVEFWDTWVDSPPVKASVTVSNSTGRIDLPPITRDIAVKMTRRSDSTGSNANLPAVSDHQQR